MPDWNPDRESHRKHKWVVHNATRTPIESVQTSKGDLKLDKDGRCLVNDEALAAEIRSSPVGKRDVCVTRVTADDRIESGHTYFFGGFKGVPYARYDEFGRRIRDDEVCEPVPLTDVTQSTSGEAIAESTTSDGSSTETPSTPESPSRAST